jgi:glycopeptide antibiotics resistance protein
MRIGDNPLVNQDNLSDPRTAWPSRTNLALIAWIGVILAAGLLPLRNFVGHSHWEYIQWTIPTRQWTSTKFYFDVVANVALFMPLGLLMARQLHPVSRSGVGTILCVGVFLSVSIEGFQIFCHNRHPSIYDLLCNVTGTGLGIQATSTVFAFPLMEWLLPRPHSHPTGSYPRS